MNAETEAQMFRKYPIIQKSLILLAMTAINSCSSESTDSDSSDENVNPSSCTSLCTASAFVSGTQTTFTGSVVECQCEGAGTGIPQESCTNYCAEFAVSAANSFLSTTNSANDKCVCDGTAGT